eukprot:g2135.t1
MRKKEAPSSFNKKGAPETLHDSHHHRDGTDEEHEGLANSSKSFRDIQGEASFFSVLMSTTKTVLGTGVLHIPYAFQKTGLCLSLILIAVIIIWSYWTYVMILKNRNFGVQSLAQRKKKSAITVTPLSSSSQRSNAPMKEKALHNNQFVYSVSEVKSFNDIYRIAFGDTLGEVMGTFLLMTHEILVCTAYLAFIAENIESVIDDSSFDQRLLIVLLTLPFIFLCYFRNMNVLRYISLVGNALLVLVVLYCIVSGIYDTAHKSINVNEAGPVILFNFSGISTFFGTVLFAFSGQTEAMVIITEMKVRKRYPDVIKIMMGPASMLYIGMGLVGSLIYRNLTQSNLFMNMSGIDSIIVRIVFSMVILLTLPLKMFPAFEIMGRYLNYWFPSTARDDVTLMAKTDETEIMKPDTELFHQHYNDEDDVESSNQSNYDGSGGIPSLHQELERKYTQKLGFIRKYFETNPLVLLLRTLLCLTSCILAILVPDFGFLVELIGSFCIGSVGFMVRMNYIIH